MLDLSGENCLSTPVPASSKHNRYGFCQQMWLGDGARRPLENILALAG